MYLGCTIVLVESLSEKTQNTNSYALIIFKHSLCDYTQQNEVKMDPKVDPKSEISDRILVGSTGQFG